MTNHASNVEIEDVLSSIRRLVSEDGRARLRPEEPPAEESETLVLTPQQRVRESDDDGGSAEPATGTGPMLLSQPLADTGEGQNGDGPLDLQTLVEREVAAALVAGDEAPEGDAAREEVVSPWSEEAEAMAGKAFDLRRAEAEVPPLEIAGGVDVGDGAPEGADGAGEASDGKGVAGDLEGGQANEAPSEGVQTGLEPRSDTEAARAAQEAAHVLFQAERAGPGKSAQSLEDKISELEAMIDQSDDGSDTAARDMRQQDPLPGLSPASAPPDAEALREIVADIVRQELQGALGERITRNVRKLVRREIQRALAEVDAE
ncbi:hypothetical protein [Roseivivax sediminis]|uniref:DUF2497 domain-containing protein n=1 Tax=Roseivivax sediminis TaxID=936889 RepID=A0A1I2CAW0_9RHOB|nr:hypothetical protein [Roseivivax sediminis]SFE65394.1 hypothetical protein SAMN04515678_11325 [Roseivivax sediminis]